MEGQTKADSVSKEALEAMLPRTDLGDPEYIKKRDNISKLTKQSEQNDWRNLLSTKEGRRICWLILGECRMFGASFNADNQYVTSYLEGKRSIGKWLDDKLQPASKENYKLMWIENYLGE